MGTYGKCKCGLQDLVYSSEHAQDKPMTIICVAVSFGFIFDKKKVFINLPVLINN